MMDFDDRSTAMLSMLKFFLISSPALPKEQRAVIEDIALRDIATSPEGKRETLSKSSYGKRNQTPLFTLKKRVYNTLGIDTLTQKLIWLAIIVLTPLSWAVNFALPSNSTAIFVLTFLALIPQAQVLGFYTEQLSLSTGEKVAALLNASLGNAVELIVAIIALVKCELEVVQASLIGSVISNLLLVTGLATLIGGVHNGEQAFSSSDAQLQSAMLAMGFSAVLFPTVFYFIEAGNSNSNSTPTRDHLLTLSRGSALVLVILYGIYLWYNITSAKRQPVCTDLEGETVNADQDEDEEPKVNAWIAGAILLFTTGLIGVTAEFLVSSINGLVESGPLSKQFVAVILLPIAGNAAEHASAIMLAWNNKMSMALDIAIGSSIQISIFVLPLIVTVAWILSKPLTLFFDLLQTVVLIVTVFVVHYIVQDGKSVWMEGVILCSLYFILCVAFQVYPGSDAAALINSCS